MKRRILAIRLHFHAHRFAYGFACGAIGVGCLTYKLDRVSEFNAFLTDHGLFDEYYALVD